MHPKVQGHMWVLGLRHCLALPSFLRYISIKRGYFLYAFMEARLLADDFPDWVRLEGAPVQLPAK
ncbi:hypothetical protein LGH70_09990 [Hymenobacter sp. BT635]|uniref:Uncharacterized protein n=1 Tax=Hymenobacter nitidus TaxID=2880929 RepID=A0ABS8ABX9_9BACT|nr:hypothetical protein [Hymenobacter nitidus]MCB2377913.1 hypothetical protein [Hymenobacter nitidus]